MASYDFDHPNALDFALISESLREIMTGRDIQIPIYDFKTHTRPGKQTVKYAPIVIFEGILAFYDESIRNLMDLKIFVLTDDDVRLGRRLLRDVTERARTPESVLIQYNMYVKKAYDEFVKPTMKYADVIIPRGRTNEIGISLIIGDIHLKLRSMGMSPSIPTKPVNCAIEESVTESVSKGELKNVVLCNDDKELLNEIIKKWMLQKDCVFNKYWYS